MIVIDEKEKCSGCHACFNVCPVKCIEMMPDTEGFLYPMVDAQRCIGCGLCEKICPVIAEKEVASTVQTVPPCYAAINRNEAERLDSSSGGVFVIMARSIIAKGGIVYGACFDEESRCVIHKGVTTVDEIAQLQGSKYVQSGIGDTFKEAKGYLDEGKPVLYTGTPCQIEGLKAYLKKDYEQLLTMDLVCHGVPSAKVWENYLKYQEKAANSKVKNVTFRNKKEGWERYAVRLVFNDKKEYLNVHTEDAYMQTFLRNVSLRPSCYACKFATINRKSDITLADFWGVNHILPEMNDGKGTSLVIVHSPRGMHIWEAVKAETVNALVDFERALEYNPCVVKSVAPHKKRKEFFEDLDKLPFDMLVNKYAKIESGITARILRKVKKTAKKMINRRGESE